MLFGSNCASFFPYRLQEQYGLVPAKLVHFSAGFMVPTGCTIFELLIKRAISSVILLCNFAVASPKGSRFRCVRVPGRAQMSSHAGSGQLLVLEAPSDRYEFGHTVLSNEGAILKLMNGDASEFDTINIPSMTLTLTRHAKWRFYRNCTIYSTCRLLCRADVFYLSPITDSNKKRKEVIR